LHYDTIHNPKHCYHFQIHWLVCTARLIEDMLSSWTRLAEKFGLKLIEAPVEQAQIKTPAKENPFQSVRYIPLSLQPPTEDASRLLLDDETISVSPQLYHIELLKHLDFILDFESDDLINTDMVEYSYSKTAHNHTQFVHKSGCAFVQIDEDGLGFYWITNRLLLTSSANFMSNVRASQGVNPEDVRRSVVKICEDPDALRVFYEDVLMRLKVTGVKIYSGSIHSL
jgi:DEP domain-containing protein 5